MPIHEAEAIVLRHYPLSDSDRIVVFFTREFGKLRATARGVQKPKSLLAGRLEPLNHIRLEFYVRQGRDLGRVRQADLIHSYLGGNVSLERACAFLYFAEIVSEVVQDNQPNDPMFRLLLASLRAGEKQPPARPLVRYFEIWCLQLSGLLPNYAYCSNCGKCVKNERFYARLDAGEARCAECATERGLPVGAEASSALERMMHVPPESFASQSLSEDALGDLERLAQKLLELHLEKQLKSSRIL